MTLVAVICGVLCAAGGLLVVDGACHRSRPPRPVRTEHRLNSVRLVRCGGFGLAGLILTRWAVAAVALGALGWCWTGLFGGRRAREQGIARTEAVASWTEMLRDTIAGSHGLEEAVITSAEVAPAAIRPEVTALAARLQGEPLD
ncbi:MAG: type II secretion system F family protein, partial [Actinomycetes bacterium]